MYVRYHSSSGVAADFVYRLSGETRPDGICGRDECICLGGVKGFRCGLGRFPNGILGGYSSRSTIEGEKAYSSFNAGKELESRELARYV